MTTRDLYEVLGIAKNATESDIKAAYRKMALKYHPDRNPNNKEAEEKFKEAAYAYEILSDDGKKRQYDQFGHAGTSHAGAGQHGFDGQSMNMDDIFEAFGDIFGGVFGASTKKKGGKSGPAAQQGHDLHKEVTIELKDSYLGVKHEVSYYHFVSCDICNGAGTSIGTKVDRCSQCKGHGQVQYQQGFFLFSQSCTGCAGKGYNIAHPCPACNGQCRTQKYEKFTITIPEGIEQDSELRVAKKGDAGVYGGPSGDLFVKIKILPDKKFKRVGNDLVCNILLTYPQLVFGCQIEIESINGVKELLKIPKGCPVSEKIVVSGKGFNSPRSAYRGNLVAITQCQIPKKISAQAKELLMSYAQYADVAEEADNSILGFFKKFLG